MILHRLSKLASQLRMAGPGEDRLRQLYDSKDYWTEVANELSRQDNKNWSLRNFVATSTSRGIALEREDTLLISVYQNWKRDGSPLKPVTEFSIIFQDKDVKTLKLGRWDIGYKHEVAKDYLRLIEKYYKVKTASFRDESIKDVDESLHKVKTFLNEDLRPIDIIRFLNVLRRGQKEGLSKETLDILNGNFEVAAESMISKYLKLGDLFSEYQQACRILQSEFEELKQEVKDITIKTASVILDKNAIYLWRSRTKTRGGWETGKWSGHMLDLETADMLQDIPMSNKKHPVYISLKDLYISIKGRPILVIKK